MTEAFHPTDFWKRPNASALMTGVGFFDFTHEQSGIALNGIELHAVLAIRFGASSGSPLPGKSKPSGNLSVSAHVSPNPVSYGSYPTLYAKKHARSVVLCPGRVLDGTSAGFLRWLSEGGWYQWHGEPVLAHGV